MEGKLYYDEKAGRYSFRYQDSDGELQDYGGIHCGEGFEVLLNDVKGRRMVFCRTSGAEAGWTYDEGVRICLITTI